MQIHKIMAGLLDAYTYMDRQKALFMVISEAAFFTRYIDHVITVKGTAHWHAMLDTEFGGMNEVLYNLYDITRNPEHLRCAQLPRGGHSFGGQHVPSRNLLMRSQPQPAQRCFSTARLVRTLCPSLEWRDLVGCIVQGGAAVHQAALL